MSSIGRHLDRGSAGWGTVPPAGWAVVADWSTMAGRCLRLTRRNLDAILTSLALPVMLLLLFVTCSAGPSRPAPGTSPTSSPGCCCCAPGSGPR
jgi:ABC-2 type transport system permease protein